MSSNGNKVFYLFNRSMLAVRCIQIESAHLEQGSRAIKKKKRIRNACILLICSDQVLPKGSDFTISECLRLKALNHPLSCQENVQIVMIYSSLLCIFIQK